MKRSGIAVAISMALAGTQVLADEATGDTAAPVALDAITVNSVRNLVDEAPADSSVSELTQKDIERNMSTDLNDLFRYEPGVSTTKDSRFGIGSISIRGLGEDRVKMSIDGVEQAHAYGPTTTYLRSGRSALDLESIEAVQVVKGGDVKEGSGALGGVVKFRTKEPSSFLNAEGDDSFVSLKSGYRSASNRFSNTATLANRSGDLESLLVYTHRDGHETENYGGSDGLGNSRGKVDPGDISSDNILGKLIYRFNDRNRGGVIFERFDGDSDLNLFSESSASSMRRSDDNTKRTRFGLFDDITADSGVFDHLHWQVDYQKTRNRNGTHMQGSTQRFVNRFYEQKGTQARLDLDKKIGAHLLSYGVEVKDESLENLNYDTRNGSTDVSRFSPKADGLSVGAYLQDNWAVTDNLTLIPSVRYDQYRYTTDGDQYIDSWGDTSDHAFTGQLGADYQLTQTVQLFGKFGESFRAPDMDDLYYYYESSPVPGISYRIRPNPNLKPEYNTFVESGIRFQNDYGSAELTAFYNHYRDFIEQVSIPSSAYTMGEFTNENLDKVTIKGLEFKGELDLHALQPAIAEGWSIRTAVAYADGKNKEDGQPLDSVSPLTWVTGIRYDQPQQRWGGEMNVTYVAGKHKSELSDNSEWLSVSSHTLVDLTGYYRPYENVRVAAGLFNLTDEKYWAWNDIRDLAGASSNLDRYTQPGRNYGVDVTVSF